MLTAIIYVLLMVMFISFGFGFLIGGKASKIVCFVTLGIAIVCAIIDLFMWKDLQTEYIIDEKIATYEEENANIESSINELVQMYIEHEKSTFTNLQGKDAISLVRLYPELNSDKLVQEQIKIYVENNNKIKELKESKINLGRQRFWVGSLGIH